MTCEHTDDKGIFQFEIKHKHGQSPIFICAICNERFNQYEVNSIIEGLQ